MCEWPQPVSWSGVSAVCVSCNKPLHLVSCCSNHFDPIHSPLSSLHPIILMPPKIVRPLPKTSGSSLMPPPPLVGGASWASVSHRVKQEKQPSVKESESIRRTEPGKHEQCLHTGTTGVFSLTSWPNGSVLSALFFFLLFFFLTKVLGFWSLRQIC